MAITPVKIGNMALAHIGAKSKIESFTENSPEASQIKLWYDFARQQTLQALDWSFARKRQVLALHGDTLDPVIREWAFKYQYPVDALTIRYLVNPSGPKAPAVPYKVELGDDGTTKAIVTNLQDARAVYTFDQELTTLYSPMFINALAFLLGFYIAYTLTGRLDVKKEMLGEYFAMLRIAEATDANQQVSDEPKDAEWVSGR